MCTSPRLRFFLVSAAYIAIASAGFTAASVALGGGEVSILQDAHTAGKDGHIVSHRLLMAQHEANLRAIGGRAFERFTASTATSAPSAATDKQKKELGADVELIGGEEAAYAQYSSVGGIQAAARALRREVRRRASQPCIIALCALALFRHYQSSIGEVCRRASQPHIHALCALALLRHY